MSAPYADAAPAYVLGGWSPIPLPAGEKDPPPKGWTGYDAPMASAAVVGKWAANGHGAGNIALRLPEHVLGIDVDLYGGKPGLATITGAITRLGTLPPTWSSTSRTDGSGIRLYRVPAGRRWADVVGPGVDIIHHGHRYAVVAPSRHPNGGVYGWLGPDGQPADEGPAVDDLPTLPDLWVDALDRGDAADCTPKADLLPGDVARFLAELPAGEPCQYVARVLKEVTEALSGGVSRHDTALRHVLRVVRAGEQGHTGAKATLDTLEAVWLDSLKLPPAREPGPGEWRRMVTSAVEVCAATPTADQDRRCCGTAADAFAADPDVPHQLDDAHLAAWMADKGLGGEWCWAGGLGWMKWDGRKWLARSDEDVREAVRLAVIEVNKRALDTGGATPERMRALTGLLSSGRIGALTSLMRGVVSLDAGAFDQKPDLLNVGNGVVDLRTGELGPHDPALLLTKITETRYEPGATHADWTKALTALDPEVADWMQVRFGQAITGYPTSDDVLPIGQGGGSNGKSTLLSALYGALGQHMVQVPEKLLRGSPNDHPTELMTLYGARLAVIDETPEVAQLNVQRLKATVGQETMTARLIRRDNVTWRATHSLFVMSNYVPSVRETDHGTWRRLALVRFTKTFPRDDRFRARMMRGAGGRREAALAWAIAGARWWYANGRVVPPAPAQVEEDTRRWRQSCDLLLAYLADRIVFDAEACVLAAELLEDLNGWLVQHGNQPWSDKLLSARLGGHEEVTRHNVDKVNPRSPRGLVRRSAGHSEAVTGRPLVWRGLRWRTDADDDE